VARFCGSPPMNVLDGEVADGAFRHAAGTLRLRGAAARGTVKLGVRPEHLELVDTGRDGALAGEVYVVEPLGNETLVTVRVDGELLNVRAPAAFDRPVGERVGVRPAQGQVHLFDAASGDALAASEVPADAGIRGEERARA
jgi:multiple sugar transport system ATP-binding protein